MEQRSGSISLGLFGPCHDDVALATAADLVRYASGPDRISTIAVAALDEGPCGSAGPHDGMTDVQGFPVRHIDLIFVREARRAGCRRVTVGAGPDNAGANAFSLRMGVELRVPASNRYASAATASEGHAT